MTNPKIQMRIGAVMTLLEKAKVPLLSDITGSLFPRFFDFDEQEMEDRLNELLDQPELDPNNLLELAAIYFIFFLKMELEDAEG